MSVALLDARRRGRWLPLSGRPWRALAYELVRLPLPAIAALTVALPVAAGEWAALAAIALPTLMLYVALAVAGAPMQRRAVVLLGRPAIDDPHRQPTGTAGWSRKLRYRLSEHATAREAAHALLVAALALVDLAILAAAPIALALLAVPLLASADDAVIGPWSIEGGAEAASAVTAGVVLLLASAYAVVALAEMHAMLTAVLLGPREEELRAQVTELAASRVRLIDAFDIERRRIERDLHDGAQQQLVALALTLDLARIELEGHNAAEAARLVDHAHAQATQTIVDLRDLIRDVHPPILVERGLAAALEVLTDRCALPVDLRVDVTVRAAQSVETAVYFVVAEALANAVKHSGAHTISIDVHQSGETLVVQVRDDGRGGADPQAGTGMTGLGDRVAALAGRLELTSPPGGPTVVRVELPTADPRSPS